MIEQISNFFTIKMIYLWLNLGVIPLWISLITIPDSRLCKYFVKSIFPFFIFSLIYGYLIYFYFLSDYDFLGNFSLYKSLENLESLFLNDAFLILFWTHFLAVNLFCGCWISNDSQRLGMSRILVTLPLLVTYFVGPFGLFLYWLIRIFFSRRFSLYD